MFLLDHRVRYEAFHRYDANGKKRKKLEKAFFGIAYLILRHSIYDEYLEIEKTIESTDDTSKLNLYDNNLLINALIKNINKFKRSNGPYSPFSIPFDEGENEKFRRYSADESITINLASSYLLTFYHYYFLVEDYRKHFDGFSFYDYSKDELGKFFERKNILITENLRFLSRDINNPMLYAAGINMTLPIKKNSGTLEKISLKEICQTILEICKGEITSKEEGASKVDPLIALGFNRLLTISVLPHFSEQLNNIDTVNLEETFNQLENKFEHLAGVEIEIPVINRIFWHKLFQNLTSLIIQSQLEQDMMHQFRYQMSFQELYPCANEKDLVANYSNLVKEMNGPLSKTLFSKILASKSSLIRDVNTYEGYRDISNSVKSAT